jgi:hypothetical protein
MSTQTETETETKTETETEIEIVSATKDSNLVESERENLITFKDYLNEKGITKPYCPKWKEMSDHYRKEAKRYTLSKLCIRKRGHASMLPRIIADEVVRGLLKQYQPEIEYKLDFPKDLYIGESIEDISGDLYYIKWKGYPSNINDPTNWIKKEDFIDEKTFKKLLKKYKKNIKLF